jgi:hypothetical protein
VYGRVAGTAGRAHAFCSGKNFSQDSETLQTPVILRSLGDEGPAFLGDSGKSRFFAALRMTLVFELTFALEMTLALELTFALEMTFALELTFAR